MSADAVIYEKQAGVATITKNNAPQYGMTLDVLTGMKNALVDANNDEDIQVIVITAGGPGFHMGGGSTRRSQYRLGIHTCRI